MKTKSMKSLRDQYNSLIEMGFIITLLVMILFMQGFKRMAVRAIQKTTAIEALKVEEIPQTQQEKQVAAPSRPSVPIASEDESLPQDETIEMTDLDQVSSTENLPPPPPPPEDDGSVIVFVAYDEPPVPVGGYGAISKHLVYPEIAKKAGVEGMVTVYAQISETGDVLQTRVMKSLTGCDQAAVDAIRAVKWKPAMQRDRPVKVWVMLPIEFKLRTVN